MNTITKPDQGWKPIPLSLKILFGIFVFWVFGSLMGLSMRYAGGLPFFGVYVYGIVAVVIVILLDVLAPLTFLFALWTRKIWGLRFALTYISIFVLNGLVALFLFREELGLMQILLPSGLNVIFGGLIYRSRNYFEGD